MTSLSKLPELIAFRSSSSLIRIPSQMDVPVTQRIMRLIDTDVFRRLSRISQLGLVSNVYPGATHSRWEHSLGVFRNSLLFLNRLQLDSDFIDRVDEEAASVFVVAALLHDIAHWPFCHAIEDMHLPEVQPHETLARRFIVDSEISQVLIQDWEIDPDRVANLLAPRLPTDQLKESILRSMLNGPIDIDKMDYLERDSLHAGVPYGRNFDQSRLISSLCVGESGQELALHEKGKTAAEMMVFARYVMFSEVYWHHAVRSATAMLQRAIYEMKERCEFIVECQGMSDAQVIERLLSKSSTTDNNSLIQGLFGPHRRLYKRLAQFNIQEHPTLHQAIARKPYHQLIDIGDCFARRLTAVLGKLVQPQQVLVDAPPVKLEVQFRISVKTANGTFAPLAHLSPVVRALAQEQFDDIVKRVRVFIAPELRDACRTVPVFDILENAIQDSEDKNSFG